MAPIPTCVNAKKFYFYSYSVAGMVAKTTVAPLDRTKILMMAHHKHYENLGVKDCFRAVLRREGVLAFYQGNGAQMVRIFPYSALQFTSFELYSSILANAFPEAKHSMKFVAGSMAGLTAVTFTFPLDMIRARLAFQNRAEGRYRGILHAGRSIWRQEGGFRGLYRGVIPSYVGMVPYAGLSFYCFEGLKHACARYVPHLTCVDGQLITAAKFACGMVAGFVAQTFSYPFDVSRRRMQLAMMNTDTHKFGQGMFSSLVHIYRSHGVVRGLYRGLSINYLRSVPMISISFYTYELMKQLLSLETTIRISTG